MNICVLGLWHLGTVISAGCAQVGHNVVGVDYDSDIIKRLCNGKAPIHEPNLNKVLGEQIASGRLRFVSDKKDIPKDIEVVWVAFDTPVDEDDIADTAYVIDNVVEILPYLPKETLILFSSQLPVGTVANIETLAEKRFASLNFCFAVTPENLRLGKALEVFLNPDRMIVGVRSNESKLKLEELVKPITENVKWMSIESAEMTKHAINAFLATSVAFANEIGSICELVGADAREVEVGLKSENRIGPRAYLSAGAAFSGGTLARDIEYLRAASKDETQTTLLSSVKVSNDYHKGWVKRRLQGHFGSLDQKNIALWGLTYKPGTNTLRRSLAVELAEWLLNKGARVNIFDPIIKELPDGLREKASINNEWRETLVRADVLIIMTAWPLFKNLAALMFRNDYPNLVILDADNFISDKLLDNGFTVLSVGSGNLQMGAPIKEVS